MDKETTPDSKPIEYGRKVAKSTTVSKSASAVCYAELWFTGDYWEINIKRDEDDVQVEFYTADDFSELLLTLEKLNDKLRAA